MKKNGCRCSLEPTRCQQLPQPVVQSRAITLLLPVTGILLPRPCFHHVPPHPPHPPVAYFGKAESNSLSVGHHGPVPRRVRARHSQNWLSTVFVATDTWNYPPVIKGGNGKLWKIYHLLSFIDDFPTQVSISRGFSSHVWLPKAVACLHFWNIGLKSSLYHIPNPFHHHLRRDPNDPNDPRTSQQHVPTDSNHALDSVGSFCERSRISMKCFKVCTTNHRFFHRVKNPLREIHWDSQNFDHPPNSWFLTLLKWMSPEMGALPNHPFL